MATPNEGRKGGSTPRAGSALLASLAMLTGMAGRIEDTEDTEAKEAAFDEWMAGQWKAINARDLKAGDKMRDAAGGEVEITGVYPSADDHVYATTKDRLGMHIPKSGVVLIRQNAGVMASEGLPSAPCSLPIDPVTPDAEPS